MEDKTEKKIKKSESKKYISLITGKVHCNEIFNLIEGKEIPKKI